MRSDCEVLVVGAGPTGLVAANVLRTWGVRTRIVDRELEGQTTSRAAVVHARTLEVLEAAGVTGTLLERGLTVDTAVVREGRRSLATFQFAHLPTRYPMVLMIPQSSTESILRERLREQGCEVEAGRIVVGLDYADNRTQVRLAAVDGSEEIVSAQYVIGADGAHSAVRHLCGIEYEGSDYEEVFVLADAELEWSLPHAQVQFFFSAEGLMVAAPLPGGRHRIVASASDPPASPDAEYVQAVVDRRGPGNTRVSDVVWGSRFHLAHRLASRYRCGSVFLAGDAAHVHSPAGGQGMNTGMGDAVDLATTLARVLTGLAPSQALSGYQSRRRPVARRVIADTDRLTRVATARNPALRTLRNAAVSSVRYLPPIRTRIAQQFAGLA